MTTEPITTGTHGRIGKKKHSKLFLVCGQFGGVFEDYLGLGCRDKSALVSWANLTVYRPKDIE